jgi:hypothetical protein
MEAIKCQDLTVNIKVAMEWDYLKELLKWEQAQVRSSKLLNASSLTKVGGHIILTTQLY